MKIDGKPYRTIWLNDDGRTVQIIDQTLLPHEFATVTLGSLEDAAHAIRVMQVRGAPLIGATAAYGLCMALAVDPSDEALEAAAATLLATRPTAVNLRWALDEMVAAVRNLPRGERRAAAYARAAEICDEDVAQCYAIGGYGLELIRAVHGGKGAGEPVNILTHCNAGWLATVDWGTALAPIYRAHDAGIPVHVWVDETRPRNQGAALTAWELGRHGVPHTLIADNVGGHLMQHGKVDLCITGTDRTAANGDVCNKIGTYLKALAASDNDVPFYVALPRSTIDWGIADGVAEIPIEERDAAEVTRLRGRDTAGRVAEFDIAPEGTNAANYAFDVTPARLVTALITERGVCAASREGLLSLYPERADGA
ncbi:S-methyl-5-thioribose-1-phosphate isomerase [Oceanibacterium hippocampi]|uniref:Methylthioribose-1-phosphate isomerase n=1 Tax=Oceanibacterium hippocampi TaxID=745714 RepID=A0A1Y5TAY2_9PROT|nr:S-methyl-5-thioribose-1-phosphate isomerase [Oceanibacterium hippocampi]SLN59609.1 Methylthioribose-1-phosphate isomerase [Oceanibacterium hippocampi]